MRELKTRAEAADVAKSQVLYISGIVAFILHMFLFSCRFKDIYTEGKSINFVIFDKTIWLFL